MGRCATVYPRDGMTKNILVRVLRDCLMGTLQVVYAMCCVPYGMVSAVHCTLYLDVVPYKLYGALLDAVCRTLNGGCGYIVRGMR